MQQIADWLEKLGMSEYAECFVRNDIDFTILSELTDHDLEKIGLLRLAIAASFCAQLPVLKRLRVAKPSRKRLRLTTSQSGAKSR